MNSPERKPLAAKWTWVLMGLLIAWAVLLALGTWWSSEESNWIRPLFILGTIGGFVAIWLIALLRPRP